MPHWKFLKQPFFCHHLIMFSDSHCIMGSKDDLLLCSVITTSRNFWRKTTRSAQMSTSDCVLVRVRAEFLPPLQTWSSQWGWGCYHAQSEKTHPHPGKRETDDIYKSLQCGVSVVQSMMMLELRYLVAFFPYSLHGMAETVENPLPHPLTAWRLEHTGLSYQCFMGFVEMFAVCLYVMFERCNIIFRKGEMMKWQLVDVVWELKNATGMLKQNPSFSVSLYNSLH